MKKKLTTVYQSDGEMRDTPAAVDRENGILYINPRLYNRLTRFEQRFVRLHEEGHYYLNTSDEFKADAYAFDRLAGTEFKSLKQCVRCLKVILTNEDKEHRARKKALYNRALAWDKDHGTTPQPTKLNKAIGTKQQREVNNMIDIIGKNWNTGVLGTANAFVTNNNSLVMAIVAVAALYVGLKILE